MENNNDKIVVVSHVSERKFSKTYHDFLDYTGLTSDEKLVYIALKSFVGFDNDKGGALNTVFPSLETIGRRSSLTKQRTVKAIKSLVQKGIVKKTQRGLTKSNMYEIADVSEMWEASSPEEKKKILSETDLEKSIRIVRAAGYEILEKKELGSAPTKDTESSSTSTNVCIDNKSKISKSQEKDTQSATQNTIRYSMEDLKSIFEYDAMISYPGVSKGTLDAVMAVMFDTLNTTKQEISFSKDDRKPTMVVIGKLMKLDLFDIMHVIHKYDAITEPIGSPDRYLLTMLYKAKEQHSLETTNLIRQNGY